MADPRPVVHFAVLRDGWGHITMDQVDIGNFPVSITKNYLGTPPLTQIMTGNPTGTATPASIKGGGLSSQWNDYTVKLKGPDGATVEMPVAQVLTSTPDQLNPGIDNLTQADGTARKAWAGWFWSIYNALKRLGGERGAIQINFEAPSIDENDSQWFFTSNDSADGTTDPLTIDVTEVGTSKYNRSLAVGDYIIWNDAAFAAINGNMYQFEIDQITAIVPILDGYTLTLQRRQVGQQAGTAAFGTFQNPHAAGVTMFRMVDKVFSVDFAINAGEQRYQFLWKNMCVAAVVATAAGGPPVLINLQPIQPNV